MKCKMLLLTTCLLSTTIPQWANAQSTRWEDVAKRWEAVAKQWQDAALKNEETAIQAIKETEKAIANTKKCIEIGTQMANHFDEAVAALKSRPKR